MKKLAIIVLALVLVVACVVVVACDKECDEHEWGEWIETTAATCTEEGVLTRTCKKCGEKETQTTDALLHKVVTVTGLTPKCRDIDLGGSAQCSRCGETISGVDLWAAIDHVTPFTLQAVAPTCTKNGLTEGRMCAVCSKTFIPQKEVPALGHVTIDVPASVATCTEPAYTAGSKCSRCGEFFSGHEISSAPLGHDFSHGDYLTYVACSRDCGIYGKLTGGDPFETEYIFDFDDSKMKEIDELYDQLKSALAGTSSVSNEDFVEMFDEFDTWVSYIQAQYQFARILNDIEYTTSSRETFATVSEYYNTTVSRYYKMFEEIDNSSYKDYFWQWTEWDSDYIDYVLSIAGSYDLDNRNEVDKILDQYEDLLNEGIDSSNILELFDLYSQLVEANNNIANTAGFDNYMDYAYERVYERDYKPEDVVAMRNFVKEYIGPVLEQVAYEYLALITKLNSYGWSSRASQIYYSQYLGTYMWRNPNDYLDDAERLSMILDVRQDVGDYFKYLSQVDSVDFYGAVQNLFESGNAFLGANTNITAYTWYVYATGNPILVFGGEDSYLDSFTFIHEFGHYYQLIHNGLLSVPMDHDETQSQGNEMLFLAWLREHMPAGVSEGFSLMEVEQLINMLGSIVLSTAVDEFEYLVYTGAQTLTDGTTPIPMVDGQEDLIDYATLYELILESYWDEIGDWFNTSYWMYVTFENAAYYISYAMSALPCLELYAKAGNDGLDAARDSYLKLFTFSSNDEFIEEDSFGDYYVTAGYETILNWAGLKGPFQEELYTSIQEFFASRV